MDAKELYLRTIQDLAKKSISLDKYDLLRSSGLMRQLLFDDPPLLHAANREARLKLSFTIVPWREPRTIMPEVWETQSLAVVPGFRRYTKVVKLDDFMGAYCMRSRSKRITVRQVILFCANVKGGIHKGKPYTKDAQMELDEIDGIMKVGGSEASLHVLPSIQQVLLAGLQPLTDIIEKEFIQ